MQRWGVSFQGANPSISLSSYTEFHWKIPIFHGKTFPWKQKKKEKKTSAGGVRFRVRNWGWVPQVSKNSVTPQQSTFIYPLFILSWGLRQQQNVQTVNFGRAGHPHNWTFVPLASMNSQLSPFLSAASGTGDKHLFEIPSSKVTAGDCPRWKFWGCFPEKAAGKME